MRWQNFLDDVFLGDRETIDFVQLLMGYIFSGDKELSLIPVFYGGPRGCKSTFITLRPGRPLPSGGG